MSRSPTEPPNEQGGTAELTETDRHRLLCAERRRAVLDVLAERTTPVELEDLVAAIAAREEDGTVPDCVFEQRVEISLHHKHLPMMTDLGAIDYDPASTRIESTHVTADLRSP